MARGNVEKNVLVGISGGSDNTSGKPDGTSGNNGADNEPGWVRFKELVVNLKGSFLKQR